MPKKKRKRDWRLIILCVLVAALTLAVCACAYQVGYFVGGKEREEFIRKKLLERCESQVDGSLLCR